MCLGRPLKGMIWEERPERNEWLRADLGEECSRQREEPERSLEVFEWQQSTEGRAESWLHQQTADKAVEDIWRNVRTMGFYISGLIMSSLPGILSSASNLLSSVIHPLRINSDFCPHCLSPGWLQHKHPVSSWQFMIPILSCIIMNILVYIEFYSL